MAAEPLTDAAAARHRRAVERARRALRDLEAEGAQITFQAVAVRARVSRQCLYTHPALRAEIERLRERRPTRSDGVPAQQRATEASLRQRLETLRVENSGYARRTRASRPSSRSPTASSVARSVAEKKRARPRRRSVDCRCQAEAEAADEPRSSRYRLNSGDGGERMLGWAVRAGSLRTRSFHARGSAAHLGSAGWLAPRPRRPASRTPVRSLRRGSLGPPPPSPGP
jgi:uncharacterized protein DUF6262